MSQGLKPGMEQGILRIVMDLKQERQRFIDRRNRLNTTVIEGEALARLVAPIDTKLEYLTLLILRYEQWSREAK